MTEFDPQAAAEAASQPGTFSFIDRLMGRNMPKDSVVVYADEEAGYALQRAKHLHSQITDAEDPRLAEVEKLIQELEEKVQASRYTFHLEAIPAEDYDKIVLAAQEQYPLEYTEHLNPLTNEVIRSAVDNEERESLINNQIWAAFIRKIEGPDGAVDENIDTPQAALLRKHLPLAAKQRITGKIVSLRMASDWMEHIQDEGFFHTP